MEYSHTQRGPMGWLLALLGVTALVACVANFNDIRIALPSGIFGVVMVLLALCFSSLTVADESDSLAVRFGPLPVFRKRVPYASISQAMPAQSSFLDGWGIHYVPGRGWIYNLWGWSCVRLEVDGRTVRIGTDDADNLVAFIRSRVGAPGN